MVQEAISLAKHLTDKQPYDGTLLRNMKQDIYGDIMKADTHARGLDLKSQL